MPVMGFNALWAKACKRDDALDTVPMLKPPITAPGLFPDRVLYSEPVGNIIRESKNQEWYDLFMRQYVGKNICR
jgi:hypothetical protein